MRKLSVALVILVTLQCVSANQESMPGRNAGETLQKFGERIIPKGNKLAHPVVRGDFGPGRGSIVIIFQPEEFRDYVGWVLTPDGASYNKYVLPELRMPISTQIEAVFFDNADSDNDKELLILCEHISGVGRHPANVTPFWTTYVYDWNGAGFTILEAVSDKLDAVGRTRTAAGVRKLLRRLGY